MKIYAAERGLNLEQHALSYIHTPVEVRGDWINDEQKLRAVANISDVNVTPDSDLFYIRSIMVSSVKNGNDDVFLPSEMWEARSTPVDKQLNFEHREDENIGHIVSQWSITDAGEVIADDTAAEDLPSLFHIAVGAVIYQSYRDDELQERANMIIDEINAGKLSVSMEASLGDFDFLLTKGEESKIVRRSEETAFLTRSLRIFGGSGEHEGYSVGRILRDITFTGLGVVYTPANPDSEIFAADKISEFSFASKSRGVNKLSTTKNSLEKIKMSEIDYAAKFEQAEARIAELNELLAKADADKFETKIVDLEAQVKDRDQKLEVSAAALTEEKEAHACMCDRFKEVEAEKEELRKELDAMKVQSAQNSRKQAFIDKGDSPEEAEAKAEKYAHFSDENFALLIEAIPAKAKSVELPEEGEKLAPSKADAEEDAEARKHGDHDCEEGDEDCEMKGGKKSKGSEEVSTAEVSAKASDNKVDVSTAIANRFLKRFGVKQEEK